MQRAATSSYMTIIGLLGIVSCFTALFVQRNIADYQIKDTELLRSQRSGLRFQQSETNEVETNNLGTTTKPEDDEVKKAKAEVERIKATSEREIEKAKAEAKRAKAEAKKAKAEVEKAKAEAEDNFYTSTWPPLQKVMCGEGAPNLHLSSELFRLARDEVFSTDDNQSSSYAPTLSVKALNTTELRRSIEEGTPTATADRFFHGNWAISVLDGNHTHQDGKLTRFRTRYVRIWKAGNNQIRLLEKDLAKHLGTADYREEVGMKKRWFSTTTEQEIEPCIYTVIRDPIDHFLSGYNEIEYREFRTHTWPSAPYHTAVLYNKTDPGVLRNRFRAFVENLLLEDGSFLVNSVYSHPFSMSRVLTSLAMIGRELDGYLPDVANLTERWPEFLSTTCPGLPPVDAFPKPELQGQHKSSGDPWGTYKASKEVWAEGGPVARAMCLLSAPDYACFDRLPAGIPEFCQTVYRDHARTLTEYGRDT